MTAEHLPTDRRLRRRPGRHLCRHVAAPSVLVRVAIALIATVVVSAAYVPAPPRATGPASDRASGTVSGAAALAGATKPGSVNIDEVADLAAAHRRLRREVLGFLPYWKLDAHASDHLRYDLLSTIALFGIGIGRAGALDRTTPGYHALTGRAAAQVTMRAHASGVRVVVTFQLFDSGSLARMRWFLGHRAQQDRFIREAVAVVHHLHSDGAVLDFEPLPPKLTGRFARFAARFAAALKRHDRHARLTVALHAGATNAQIAAVGKAADRVLAMAYDYHWPGSRVAGAVAPLDGPGPDVRKTLARFIAHAPRRKVLVGVPYFGYDWPVSGAGPNAPVQAPASRHGGTWSIGYTAVVDFLRAHRRVKVRWDAVARSPHFTYRDTRRKTYREVWFENERSLRAKYAIVDHAGVAGIGIWALGMDRGRAELWEAIRRSFATRARR